MKKIITLILALAMALTLCCPALAATLPAMTFELSCDGSTVHTMPRGGTVNALEYVKTGDEITVFYTISAASNTNCGVSQDEIYYDHNFFSLVSNSCKTESDFPGFYATAQIRSGDRHFVFFDTVTTYAYGAQPKKIGSFTLKVIAASGASVITNTSYGAAQNLDKYSITTHDLWVGFGEWDGATYQVTLDVGDGVLPQGSQSGNSINTEKNQKLTLPAPTRLFYTFDYWTDGVNTYKAGAQYSPSDHTTLTAHWTAVPSPAAPTGLGSVNASRPDAKDGKITGVTTAMEYTASTQIRPTACTGTTVTGLGKGTYYVRLKENPATNQPAGEYAEVKVGEWPLRPAPTGLSAIKTSLPDALDGTISGTTTQMEYSMSKDFATAAPCTDKQMTGLKAGIYFIRYIFDTANNKAASEAAQVTVIAGNAPDAPTGLSAVSPSLIGVKDGKIKGVKPTMEYSTTQEFTDAISCPDGEITGLAAGSYYIRLKADPSTNTPAGNCALVEVPKGPLPPSEARPTADSAASDLTVKTTVSEDAVATVSAVSDAEIKKAAAGESGVVAIDLSDGDEAVESAKLPSGLIGKIANAVKANGKGGFALRLTSANLEFDMKALQSLASQAGSGELQIDMRDTGTMALNEAQYNAVKNLSIYGGYSLSATVGQKTISQFDGGTIRIGIPFNIPDGRYSDGFCVYYVAEDGKLTRMATSYDGGKLNFAVNHFSDYIIAYSDQPNVFTDVLPGDWYYDNVVRAYGMGLINGKTETEYKPDDNMTYAEAVKLAACMNQLYTNGAVTLTNASEGKWYDSYVTYAMEHGILSAALGSKANKSISRKDYVELFYNALPAEAYGAINTISKIPDLTENAANAKIYAFYRAGILTGYANTAGKAAYSFGANDNIRRSEVATILIRMMDAGTRVSFTL